MAFDMFAGTLHEAITHEEEVIFNLAAKEESRFPNLVFIWKSFYKDPKLSSSQARRLASELTDLLACNGGAANKGLSTTVERLAPFFHAAALANEEIRCQSD